MSKHRAVVVGAWLLLGAWGAACSAGDPPLASPDGGTKDAAASDADASPPVPDAETIDSGTDGGAPVVCPGGPTVASEQITLGTPAWKMSELKVLVAPVGTTDVGPMLSSLSAMFGPNHVQDDTWKVFKPATAHGSSFATEVSDGISKGGFVAATSCIPFAATIAPSGIIVSMSIVPSASASSMPLPDLGTVGPSVGTFLLVDADLYIDGVLVDPDFDSTYPAAGQVYTMPDAGWTQGLPGWSHILLNFGENQAFATGTLKKGEWELRIKLTVPQTSATVDSIKFWVQ